MPKKTRRASKVTKKPKISWTIVFATFIPVILVLFLLTNSGKSGVLGTSTNSTSNLTSNCKQMISVISFSNPCMGKSGPGFKSVTYTCSDGTGGSSTKDCLLPQQAFEKMGKVCSKGSNCKTPQAKVSATAKQGKKVLDNSSGL